jgi:PAS domain S-box-containing protein
VAMGTDPGAQPGSGTTPAGVVRTPDAGPALPVDHARDAAELDDARRQAAGLAEHLSLALAAGQLGTWRWDLASGAVTWDAAMERLYGLEPGSFPGTYDAWLELRGHAEGRETATATLEAAIADQEPYEIETEVVWPDGSVHWLHGWGRATVDRAGQVTGAIGCTADITARKNAELDMRRRAAELAETARRERLQRERLAFLARITDAALAAQPGTAPDVAVAHADPERVAWVEELRRRYPFDPDAPTGAAAVIRRGEAEFVPVVDEAYLDAALASARMGPDQARAILDELKLTSIITVPLRSTRGVLGALQLVSAESGRRYTDDDLALVEAASGRIAETLNNLWLTQQQRSIAETLQSALLPPALPAVPGVDIAARYWAAGAANDVGGDFYDVFVAGPGRWVVVIGDVCGTGADGAAVTAIARHTIRAAATHGVEHAEVIQWVNDAVVAGRRNRFCTAVYATLEPLGDGGHDLTLVSGGHPLPVLARADGTVTTVGSPGTLIGVFPRVTTKVDRVRLDPGDTLVLYTDGITDLRPPHGLTAEDVDRMVATAVRGAGGANEIAEAMRVAIETIRPIPDRGDDIALLVLRVGPDAGRPAGTHR